MGEHTEQSVNALMEVLASALHEYDGFDLEEALGEDPKVVDKKRILHERLMALATEMNPATPMEPGVAELFKLTNDTLEALAVQGGLEDDDLKKFKTQDRRRRCERLWHLRTRQPDLQRELHSRLHAGAVSVLRLLWGGGHLTNISFLEFLEVVTGVVDPVGWSARKVKLTASPKLVSVDYIDGIFVLGYGFVAHGRDTIGADLRVTKSETARLGAILVDVGNREVQLRGTTDVLERLLTVLSRSLAEAGLHTQFFARPIGQADLPLIRDALGAEIKGGELRNPDGALQGFGGIRATKDQDYQGSFLDSDDAQQLLDRGYEVDSVDLVFNVQDVELSCRLNLPAHRLYFRKGDTTEEAIQHVLAAIDEVLNRDA
jgi:hypothetical protein